jgi:hypothetical protein
MAARGKKDDGAEGQAEGERAERRASSAGAEGGPLAALVAGLDEIVPGLEVLDRELTFENGARADLAAVDPSGRLFLVLLAGEDADKTVLATLDTLSVARSQVELLVRHFGDGRMHAERSPRVLVVSPNADTQLSERLGVLVDAGVSVLGLRTVKSAKGERAYLVRMDQATRGPGGTSGITAFLRALPPRLEPLGNTLIERMERFDEELVASGDASTLVWRIAGEVLCRVERIGDVLQGSIAPRHEPLSLHDLSDLDKLIEGAYARLVKVLGLSRNAPPAAGPRPAPSPDEPLLTAEEIQAFRE